MNLPPNSTLLFISGVVAKVSQSKQVCGRHNGMRGNPGRARNLRPVKSDRGLLIIAALVGMLTQLSMPAKAAIMHASAGASNETVGGSGAVTHSSTGENSAIASYQGPNNVYYPWSSTGRSGSATTSGSANAGVLNASAYVDTIYNFYWAQAYGGAAWLDTWHFNPGSGAPMPAAVRFHFKVSGGVIPVPDGHIKASVTMVGYNESKNVVWGGNYTGPSIDDSFWWDSNVSPSGEAAFEYQLVVEAQADGRRATPNGSPAVVQGGFEVALTDVTLIDGTSFRLNGSFESGMVPAPEPSTIALAGMGLAALVLVSLRKNSKWVTCPRIGNRAD